MTYCDMHVLLLILQACPMWSVLKYKKFRVLARVIVAIGRVILIIVYNDDQIKKETTD